MVKKMANRSYRAFLAKWSLRLNVLGARMTIFKEVGDLCKQVWFVPFTWSLAWYLSWIFYDVAIWQKPLIQVNPWNYVGATTSVAVLLFGTQLRTRIRKEFVLAGTQFRAVVQKSVPFFGIRIRTRIHELRSVSGIDTGKVDRLKHVFACLPIAIGSRLEKSGQLKPQVKQSSTKRRRVVEKPKQPKQLNQELSPGVNTYPQNVDYSHRRQEPEGMPKEIPDECLICADLINCVYRRNKSYDLESQHQNHIPCQRIQDNINCSEGKNTKLKDEHVSPERILALSN
jgi:hypothetical protein